jgi:hypothetical protein
MGAPEILLVLLLVSFVGLIDAIRHPEWAYEQAGQKKARWILLILVSWVIALGWIVAIGFLFGPGRSVRREHRAGKREETPASVAAGWYPDPSGSGGTRYWDGSTWTAQTRPTTARV